MLSRRGVLGALAVPFLRGQETKPNMFGNAEAYERFIGRWSRLLAPLLVDFADIADTGRVLDVGSGTGSLAFAIAERKPRCQVMGIDPSEAFIAYASDRNRFGERTSFEVGDAQQLRFADATFQSSLALLVFNFIPDPAKALRELVRVTRPGGVIAAAVWDYGAGMRMLRVFFEAAVSVDPGAQTVDEKHMPLCRAGELSRLWTDGGLKGVSEKPLDITMRFASFADYWDAFLLRQGPAGTYVARLGQDRLQVVRDAVKKRLPLSGEDSPFDLPARAWAVRGTV